MSSPNPTYSIRIPLHAANGIRLFIRQQTTKGNDVAGRVARTLNAVSSMDTACVVDMGGAEAEQLLRVAEGAAGAGAERLLGVSRPREGGSGSVMDFLRQQMEKTDEDLRQLVVELRAQGVELPEWRDTSRRLAQAAAERDDAAALVRELAVALGAREGANLSEVARLARVSRPTLYAWLDDASHLPRR